MKIAPGDLDVAVVGQLPAADFPMGDQFQPRLNEEVRSANFGTTDDEVDLEAVAIAATNRMGTFDPSTFRDGYQDTLREMIQAKVKSLPLVTQPARPRSSHRPYGRFETQVG